MTYARKYNKKKTKKTYRKKKTTNNKTVQALVDKAMSRKVETKQTSSDPREYTFLDTNADMSPAVDLIAQFIDIPNGTKDGQRIGEEIQTKKAELKLLITAPTNVTQVTEPWIVQVWIGYYKKDRSSTPNADQLARIYDDGAGISESDGNLLALLRNNNTDEFRIMHYRKFKVGQSDHNNDFKYYRTHTFDLTSKMGKLTFGDTVGTPNIPVNKNLYMWCQYTSANNSRSAKTYDEKPNLRYYMNYQYTDL
ncbi:MAG: putative capsid protein [Circoviridae sp.]|nr:MAG: putative capsid protein [Circoviridae sp.]